jgi:hypothetical protein
MIRGFGIGVNQHFKEVLYALKRYIVSVYSLYNFKSSFENQISRKATDFCFCNF